MHQSSLIGHEYTKHLHELPPEKAERAKARIARKPTNVPHLRKCDLCPFTTNHYGSMHTHMRTVHGKQRNHSCPYAPECTFTAYHKQGLTTHINGVHLNIRPFECDLCGKSFKYRNHFRYVLFILLLVDIN